MRLAFVLLLCIVVIHAKGHSVGLRPIMYNDPSTRAAFASAPARTAEAKSFCPSFKVMPPAYDQETLRGFRNAHRGNTRPRIGIGIPVTSPGRNYEVRAGTPVEELSIVKTFIQSLVTVMPANETAYQLELYLAIEEGDPFYDNAGNWELLSYTIGKLTGPKAIPLTLKPAIVLPVLGGNVVYAWNHALAQAYIDGCNYLYQASEANQLETPNFFDKLLTPLVTCRRHQRHLVRNVGVTCPSDALARGQTRRICFQALVHRSHYDALGFFFDPVFAQLKGAIFITSLYRQLALDTYRKSILANSTNTDTTLSLHYPCDNTIDVMPAVSTAVKAWGTWFASMVTNGYGGDHECP